MRPAVRGDPKFYFVSPPLPTSPTMCISGKLIFTSEFFTYAQKMPKLHFHLYKMLLPVGIEPRPLIASDCKSNTLFSTLT